MQTRFPFFVLFVVLVLVSLAAPAWARPPGHPGRGPMMHGPHMHHPHHHRHWWRPPLHRHVTERSIVIVNAPVVVAPVAPVAGVSQDAAAATRQRWLPAGYVHHSQDEWRHAYMGDDAYQAQIRPSTGVVVGGSGVTSFVYHEQSYDNFGHPWHLGHRRFGPPPPGRRMHHRHGPGRGGRMRR